MKRFTFIAFGLLAACLVGCGDEESPAQAPAVPQAESHDLTLEQLRQSRQESRVELPPPAVFVAAEPSQTGADAHTYTVFFQQIGVAFYLDWERVGQMIFKSEQAGWTQNMMKRRVGGNLSANEPLRNMTLVRLPDIALSEQAFCHGLKELCADCGFPEPTVVSPEEIKTLEESFMKDTFGD